MKTRKVHPSHYSPLQRSRLGYRPPEPKDLTHTSAKCIVQPRGGRTSSVADSDVLARMFPNIFGQPHVDLRPGTTAAPGEPLKVGVVLSGGQAAGGHNVICGLFDYLKARNPRSSVVGFLGGPIGVINGNFIDIDADLVNHYRNQGGFDMIGTGRDKIETEKQFQSSKAVCEKLQLDGLVIIGGDDSNTNAALLAEYFRAQHLKTKVIGVPKTIDGDLKSDQGVELSFGFDSACKVYASLIGNIATDALSAGKYYHFIRLMGRSASHITLEAALQTHPNVALIGEEVAAKNQTLEQITRELADVICTRANDDKHFGIVLVPEGLIEFIPEVGKLISELNELLAANVSQTDVPTKLSEASRKLFEFLPNDIRQQLLLDRDPHGNVQVSKIETENLLIHLLKTELKKRKANGSYKGSFAALGHFFGYEGRCVPPSVFDCNYCYALGRTAAALLEGGLTGYMAVVRNVWDHVDNWKCGGLPLTTMMNVERRKGKDKPVIRKALVELDKEPFLEFARNRAKWAVEECYRNPGPIQYVEGVDEPNLTLQLEYGKLKRTSSSGNQKAAL